jgi:hypothetical protein
MPPTGLALLRTMDERILFKWTEDSGRSAPHSPAAFSNILLKCGSKWITGAVAPVHRTDTGPAPGPALPFLRSSAT